MRPESLHVTLCFLSYHPEKAIPRIAELIASVPPRPVELRFDPEPSPMPKGRPRLYAVGGRSESAAALQAELAEALAAERFYEPEKRGFWPHVTVARVRSERLAPEPGKRRGKGRPRRVKRAPAPLPAALDRALRSRPDRLSTVPISSRRGPSTCPLQASTCRPARGIRRGDEKMADAKKAELKAADKEAQAKSAALKAAVTQIEKDFGQGSVMRLGDKAAIPVETIPTGALSLDLALGVGGVPRGRIVEIFGPESSGKTTLVYHIIAEAQARGGVCAFVDAEHAIDPIYAKRIGVDTDELLVSQPDYGEQALEIVDVLVRSGAVDVVAVDSVAALTPRVELEGQMGEQQVGLQARMMSQAMRKLAGNLNRAKTVCLFTNQIREKIGVMFGSPETQPGGRALKFYSLAAARHPPDRDPQGGHRGGRQPGPRQGGQEQGRGAVPPGRVRHHLRRGDLARGLPARPRARARPGPEVGLVLLLRRAAPRPGPQQHQAVPAREPRTWPREIEAKLFAELGIERTPAPPRAVPDAEAGRGRRGRAPKAEPRRSSRAQGRLAGAAEPCREEAFERALEALAQRERTSGELAAWLAERGFEPAEVEDAGRAADRGRRDRRRALRGRASPPTSASFAAGGRSGSARRCASAGWRRR